MPTTLETARAVERLIIVACAPLLLYIGYRLLVLGVTGQIRLSANIKSTIGANFTNLSPGALCFVLATAIGVVSLSHPISWTTSTGAAAASPSPNVGGSFSYLAGPAAGATQYVLSIDLRRGLSELFLCQNSLATADKDSCYQTTGWTNKFKRIPKPDDLKQIEAVEQRLSRSPTEADAVEYANMKNAYLKGKG